MSSARHRPRGPTTRHQSISVVVCDEMWSFLCRTAKGSREPSSPLEGVWGVNTKPQLKVVGVVGAGFHADANAREVGAPQTKIKRRTHHAHTVYSIHTLSPKPQTLTLTRGQGAPQRGLRSGPFAASNTRTTRKKESRIYICYLHMQLRRILIDFREMFVRCCWPFLYA